MIVPPKLMVPFPTEVLTVMRDGEAVEPPDKVTGELNAADVATNVTVFGMKIPVVPVTLSAPIGPLAPARKLTVPAPALIVRFWLAPVIRLDEAPESPIVMVPPPELKETLPLSWMLTGLDPVAAIVVARLIFPLFPPPVVVVIELASVMVLAAAIRLPRGVVEPTAPLKVIDPVEDPVLKALRVNPAAEVNPSIVLPKVSPKVLTDVSISELPEAAMMSGAVLTNCVQ